MQTQNRPTPNEKEDQTKDFKELLGSPCSSNSSTPGSSKSKKLSATFTCVSPLGTSHSLRHASCHLHFATPPEGEPSSSPRYEGAGPPYPLGGGVLSKAEGL